ncbi:hypothetical protein FK498_10350 [Elioraea sp. Yellowstone]|nr:hypothetical protein FK498_10350 [Elioraea sp. Yellowstone]
MCRRHGIGGQTLCNWKARHGGVKLREALRLKGLEDESRRLKKGSVRGGGGSSGFGRGVGLGWPSALAAGVELQSSHS